jgi:putative NADH-flavin reductase
MQVLVIGAAGRTGRAIVEQALGHGHSVRAFVRSTPLKLTHPRLEIVTGDVLDEDAVAAAVAGTDAAAFAIGRSSGGGNVHSEGIGNVLFGMALHNVFKLAAVSAAGAFARDDSGLSIGFRLKIATQYRALYDDLERMEQRIAASALEWTIIRPMGLSEGPFTGEYRFTLDGSIPSKPARVGRGDVAALVLKALETDQYVRRTLVISGGTRVSPEA